MKLRTVRVVMFMVLASLALAQARAAVPKLTSGPTARRDGDAVKIAFAVNEPTDAEVAILDAKGNVVRHLGAAALGGENKPLPPFLPGLNQSITWDGKNDAGTRASGGPFKARVQLGLTGRLDRIVGWSGQNIDRPRGMICGPDGTLYVMHGSAFAPHRESTLITAHDRDGQYLHQVAPGPANLPPEKRKGWPRMRLSEEEELPVVFQVLSRSTYPGMMLGVRNFPVVTTDGRLIVLSALRGGGIKYPDIRGGRRLLTLGCDGSVPQNCLGPVVFPADLEGFGHLALSPDEKTVYIAGLFEPGKKGKGLCQVVWRASLDQPGDPQVLVGKLYRAGTGKDGLSDPQGLATDADGNLYVADYGNDRIAVFKPDGRYLGEIPVRHPDQVRVHRKTGAVYVMCLEKRTKPITDGHYFTPAHNWKMARVVKFGGMKDKTEKASLVRPKASRYGGGALLALDESGEEPVLWVCDPTYGRRDVVKIIDRGDSLEALGDPIHGALKQDEAFYFIDSVTVSGDRLVCRDRGGGGWSSIGSLMFDANTGAPLGRYEPKSMKGSRENVYSVRAGDTAAGPDGLLYYHVINRLRRYDVTGKPVPFEAVGSNVIENMPYGHVTYAGLFVHRNGDIYVPTTPENRKLEDISLRILGPDGKEKNAQAVHIQGAKTGGVVVDSRGNIYMGAQVFPMDKRIPEVFAGKLPKDYSTARTKNRHPSNAYRQIGAILKFPPAGGKVVYDEAGKHGAHCYYKLNKVGLKNVLWLRRGGLLPTHGAEAGCNCESTRFDIDRFDRLFVPDPFRFSIGVLDSAGNEIARIGSYGNMDSRGPDSPVPTPELTFGWPIAVACAHGRVYVADLVNRRVVSVRLEHAATAECPIN